MERPTRGLRIARWPASSVRSGGTFISQNERARMLVARGGPTMFARIDVMKVLDRHVVREFKLGLTIRQIVTAMMQPSPVWYPGIPNAARLDGVSLTSRGMVRSRSDDKRVGVGRRD